jgi:hypothetical protein
LTLAGSGEIHSLISIFYLKIPKGFNHYKTPTTNLSDPEGVVYQITNQHWTLAGSGEITPLYQYLTLSGSGKINPIISISYLKIPKGFNHYKKTNNQIV